MASAFEVMEELEERLDESPVPLAETWGTSRRAQRAYAEAEAKAGGPARMREGPRPT